MTRSIEDRIASLETNVADHEQELARSRSEQVLYDIASLWMAVVPEGAAWPDEAHMRMHWTLMMRQFRAAGVEPMKDEDALRSSRSAR